MKRWPVILAVIHVVLMSSLIVREERKGRHNYALLQRSENLARHIREHPAKYSNTVGWDCSEVDYRPSYPVRAVYNNNLPLSLAFGYYSHALSACSLPNLVSIVNERTPVGRLSVVAKVWIFNSVLILVVAAQWWLIGRWTLLPGRKLVKATAVAITTVAVIFTVVVLANLNYNETTVNWSAWVILPCLLFLPGLWFGMLVLAAIECIGPFRRMIRSWP